jgi:hypothetical protein
MGDGSPTAFFSRRVPQRDDGDKISVSVVQIRPSTLSVAKLSVGVSHAHAYTHSTPPNNIGHQLTAAHLPRTHAHRHAHIYVHTFASEDAARGCTHISICLKPALHAKCRSHTVTHARTSHTHGALTHTHSTRYAGGTR